MLVADYERNWEYLSRNHETKDKEIRQILDNYRSNKSLRYVSYAVLGTYGVGKTHFLYHIHKRAIENGIVPLYFLAEDLFREIITDRNRTWTPGDLYGLIEGKIKQITSLIFSGEMSELHRILDPRGKISSDSPKVIEAVVEKFSGITTESHKLILLVDELEGQYGNLQQIVETMDRSPLREWLESKTHVKFLAFAPAGIYELGGADRDRVKRIVIPSADVKYVRSNLIKDAGKSNSCWWLSRGKARQLFKTVEVLNTLTPECFEDTSKAARVIKEELDSIGQPPTEVPPALSDKIIPSRIPYLLKLAPITCERGRRYIIDNEKLQTGELASRLIDAFGLTRNNAILISEYFKKTTLALSDDDWLTFVDERDLPELFCLALDHFLEYEHGNPELSKTFGEILSLYEKSKEEHAAMHGTIGTLWERRETDRGLPLSIEEIRETFPFPTMNPIVKNHVPDDMKRKWEGEDIPLWIWMSGNVTFLFCASARDLIAYSQMDEFLSLSVPDGKGVICLLPYGEDFRKAEKKPIFKWLEENGKLKVIKLQHLLADFLLSASGELTTIPGDLLEIIKNLKENKEDILLSRKTGIYERALIDTLIDELPKPKLICKANPPDADTVWGRTQIARTIAISGIALAFPIMKTEERVLLADLRELFKGGREGRGIGDLRYLISSRDAPGRGGHTRLPDRLLPYRARGAVIRNTESIEKLRTYWSSDDIDKIAELARILPLNEYLKLHQDEDISRLLEALWRTVREEFEERNLEGFIIKLEKEIIPTLKACQDLEDVGAKFGLQGIDFGDYTHLVKSLQGYEELLEIAHKAGDTSPLTKSIVSVLIETTTDMDSDVRVLDNLCSNAKRVLEDLKAAAEQLRENFWEYKRAVKFAELGEEAVTQMVSDQMKMDGTLDLQEVERAADEKREYLDEFSTSLSQLEQKLKEIEALFVSVQGG